MQHKTNKTNWQLHWQTAAGCLFIPPMHFPATLHNTKLGNWPADGQQLVAFSFYQSFPCHITQHKTRQLTTPLMDSSWSPFHSTSRFPATLHNTKQGNWPLHWWTAAGRLFILPVVSLPHYTTQNKATDHSRQQLVAFSFYQSFPCHITQHKTRQLTTPLMDSSWLTLQPTHSFACHITQHKTMQLTTPLTDSSCLPFHSTIHILATLHQTRQLTTPLTNSSWLTLQPTHSFACHITQHKTRQLTTPLTDSSWSPRFKQLRRSATPPGMMREM